MSQGLNQNGIYTFSCFSPRVRAAYSGREVTRDQFPEFVEKAGFTRQTLSLVHQVHGTEVLCVQPGSIPPRSTEADGLLTDSPGIVIGVKTADCLPVFFEDPVRGVVGAVHAGWRGLQAGILEKAVAKMTTVYGTEPSDLKAAIGPAIRGCCYEVGPEFASYFPGFYKEGRKSGQGAGGMFDPAQAAVSRLREAGVKADQVTDSGLCTACRMDLFYSFRGENTRERILSVIALGIG